MKLYKVYAGHKGRGTTSLIVKAISAIDAACIAFTVWHEGGGTIKQCSVVRLVEPDNRAVGVCYEPASDPAKFNFRDGKAVAV